MKVLELIELLAKAIESGLDLSEVKIEVVVLDSGSFLVKDAAFELIGPKMVRFRLVAE